ncbi:MAG: Cthe_2314 family HEPN domain-containing protein [Flavobacteriaceae bacterium]
MTQKEIIDNLNNEIADIIRVENLIPLAGKDLSFNLNGKQILSWHNEVTRHCSIFHNGHFSYLKNLDDIIFSSDEIVYFTAHLFLYAPYINTPLKDAYRSGEKMIYPVFTNLYGKRYDMYLGIVFEKVYNYWDRIGDLIASFFPELFSGNIFFPKTIKTLEIEYAGNENYDWLLNFLNNDFTKFNEQRIQIVHYFSKSTNQKWEQLNQVWDYEKSKQHTDQILSYPGYFKEMNEISKIGFEKTLLFLEEVNRRKNYNCG